jgi:putative aldouronate transport system permease protein
VVVKVDVNEPNAVGTTLMMRIYAWPRVTWGRWSRLPAPDRVFVPCVYLLLFVFLLVVLLPLLYILASSFSSPEAVSSGRVLLWPQDFSLRGYKAVFESPVVLRGYLNSLFYTVVGTALSLTLTIAIAYPLSIKGIPGGRFLLAMIVLTMLFSGGLIPTFTVVRSLNILDTRWALILPQAIGVWQVIIARTFFRHSLPIELYDAARLDGCSEFRYLWSVVLPLSRPMLAVVALMYAVAQWNTYFDALIYLRSPDLYPLQLVLRDVLILNSQTGMEAGDFVERQQLANLLKYSLIVVSTVPMLVLYPFVARHFTKGLLIGAVKG